MSRGAGEAGARGRFMVALTFDVPAREQQQVAALIPREQAHIRQLAGRGVVESLQISTDRSCVWLVMRGASREAIEQELTAFPLYPYMRPEITELLPS